MVHERIPLQQVPVRGPSPVELSAAALLGLVSQQMLRPSDLLDFNVLVWLAWSCPVLMSEGV